MKFKTPWLHKAWFDLLFILLPPVFSVSLVLFPGNTNTVPLWAWVVFVLGIDVAHVYSTLFRTYFNPAEFAENRTIYTLIPVIVWVTGVMLYSVSAGLFWSSLAYLAVFHFIRQQYGFMRLYSRNETLSALARKTDALVVYLGTLYPIIYWHAHLPRNFNWFVEGDFLTGLPVEAERVFFLFYLAAIALYIAKELYFINKFKVFNIPKNLIVSGTLLSWYVGIVMFNGDMVFTITNIVSHGIPYMALVWIYGKKHQAAGGSGPAILRAAFSAYGPVLFILVLFVFAYIEEGMWAGLVWREHLEIFGVFSVLPVLTDKSTLSWVIPLLSLPQATHYVLDGFIWKLKDEKAAWQKVMFFRKVGTA